MFALSFRYITACRKFNYTIFKATFQTLGSRSVHTIRDTMAGIETIPVLYVKGSNNYDIGFTIGKTFKSWIQEHLALSDDAKRYHDFYATDDGHVIVDTYKANGDKSHPNIMSELRGTADGAEVKFDDLFLLHIASEIDFCHLRERAEAAVDEKANTPKGCTDVLLNRKDCRIIGHNEDWTADVAKRDYLVHATIVDENGGIKEQFLSYCYPGNLSGFCFGMNKSLVFSLNSLCPKEANRHSTPLLVCLRSLLGCHTVEECETAMRNEPFGCAYGMNINIASINGNEMCSIEVSPHKGKTQVIRRDVSQEITPGNDCYYYHTNIYRFSEVNQSTDGMGSRLREDRIAEMTSPKNSQDVRGILGDTANEKHPIHLLPNPKHIRPNLKTSATAIFDINEKMLHVYKGNPKTSTMPTLSIPFFGQ